MHGRDCMVVGFMITYAISAYHHKSCEFKSHSGDVYSIQRYVISLLVTCGRLVVLSGYSGLLHQ
jgi:hypothetical protein